MSTKLITLSKAIEGMRYLKHLCAGILVNIRGANKDIECIIRQLAETNPEILESKPHPKSSLTLKELLEIVERDGNELNRIFREEVK